MSEIYFVRHGQSQANADRVIAGGQDSPLTEEGLQQAQDEAKIIHESGLKFNTILSSPLSRAYDTAKIIAERNQYPIDHIVVIDDLKEKSSGDFEGGSPEKLFSASDDEVRRAGAETFDDIAARVRRANIEITKHAVGTTLIVGHSGFYRAAQCVAQNLPPAEMVHIDKPTNGKLTRYPLS